MQIKFISSILLASTALIPTIIASASPAPAPAALAAANPIPVANANPDLGDIGDKIDDALEEVGDKIDDTVEKIKDKTSEWVEELKSWKFPTLSDVPADVKQWFKDAKKWFQDFPQEAWEEIKKGVYPQEVSDWINSLPEKVREEAREELREWANESDAVSNLRGLSYGFVGIAGVAAVMLTF